LAQDFAQSVCWKATPLVNPAVPCFMMQLHRAIQLLRRRSLNRVDGRSDETTLSPDTGAPELSSSVTSANAGTDIPEGLFPPTDFKRFTGLTRSIAEEVFSPIAFRRFGDAYFAEEELVNSSGGSVGGIAADEPTLRSEIKATELYNSVASANAGVDIPEELFSPTDFKRYSGFTRFITEEVFSPTAFRRFGDACFMEEELVCKPANVNSSGGCVGGIAADEPTLSPEIEAAEFSNAGNGIPEDLFPPTDFKRFGGLTHFLTEEVFSPTAFGRFGDAYFMEQELVCKPGDLRSSSGSVVGIAGDEPTLRSEIEATEDSSSVASANAGTDIHEGLFPPTGFKRFADLARRISEDLFPPSVLGRFGDAYFAEEELVCRPEEFGGSGGCVGGIASHAKSDRMGFKRVQSAGALSTCSTAA